MIKRLSSKHSTPQTGITLNRIAEIYQGLEEKKLQKGYWIVNIEVKDAEGYENYKKASSEPLLRYGAKFLVRGGTQQTPEGSSKARTVVIEFPDLRAAQLCYESPQYQQAQAIRTKYSVADLVIVEGA
tara:strand:- start:1758 stop:2141 length:384 start_codon:yes stop_codon:yes gene_type:complete